MNNRQEQKRKAAFDEAIRLLRENSDPEAATTLLRNYVAGCSKRQRHLALGDLSYLQTEAGDLQGALDSISEAIALAPEYPGHRDARSLLALRIKEYDLARQDCAELLLIEERRKSPAFVNAARVTRALAFMEEGNGRAALEDLRHVEADGVFRRCGRTLTTADLVSRATALCK